MQAVAPFVDGQPAILMQSNEIHLAVGPGGQRPTRGEFRRSVAAGRTRARNRDLPDPVAWADLIECAEVAFDRLDLRLRSRRYPMPVTRFTLPKTGSKGLRIITSLDIYDELALRVLTGRVVPAIENAINRESVLSYQLGAGPPAWWTKDHREPIAERRRKGLAYLNDDHCAGLGTMDITDYYRSVDPVRLNDVLARMRAPIGGVEALTGYLSAITSNGGPGGLPIGFEGSGVLANAFLHPMDQIVQSRGPFTRYTDDVWCFLRSKQQWEEVVPAVEAELDLLGLALNESKTRFWDKVWDDAYSVIINRTLDSITGGGGGNVEPSNSLELLETEISGDTPDWAIIRFALSNLTALRYAPAVRVLEGRPELFIEAPVHVGRYFLALAQDTTTRSDVDRDWLLDRAVADGASRSLASQVWACIALSQLHLSSAHGQRLFDLAAAFANFGKLPLQVWAATAWGHSEAWKPALAVQATEHFGALSVRRSFCLTMRRRSGRAARRSVWHRHLLSVEPDLAPTLAYAFEAA